MKEAGKSLTPSRAPDSAWGRDTVDAAIAMCVLRVRIVEDDELMRVLLLAQIGGSGIPVDVSSSATGYHALIEIATSPPDVILTDIVMQGIDGFELIETVLAQNALKRVRLAVVTSMPPEEIQKHGGIPDGVMYFQKPVDPHEMRRYLRACYADLQRTHDE